MQVVLLLAAGLLALGVAESLVHSRRVSRIPIRVHVNGTRGKSTTTRLVAAGLRAGGLRVVAKTTGTAARLILEDGSEVPVKRKGPATIREQRWVAAEAYRRRADALVVECMALSPETQWTSEHRIIRSGIGVITNVRADHLDVMGPGIEDVAASLSLTIPKAGHLVTAEERFLPTFARRAASLSTRLHAETGQDVSDDQLRPFPYMAFGENVACALKVCELAGVPREVALAGMWAARPDPGVLRVYRIRLGGRHIFFANAFAANDADSTGRTWERCRSMEMLRGLPVMGVLNGRSDRALRSAELVEFAARAGFDRLALIGQLPAAAGTALKRRGIHNLTLDFSTCRMPELLLQAAADAMPGDFLLFAFGNVKGSGQTLADYFEKNGEALS